MIKRPGSGFSSATLFDRRKSVILPAPVSHLRVPEGLVCGSWFHKERLHKGSLKGPPDSPETLCTILCVCVFLRRRFITFIRFSKGVCDPQNSRATSLDVL